MKDARNIVPRLPLISLLAANAVPLFGVLFLKWDAFNIVLLYWAENLAVGFYNVLKMALVKVKEPKEHLGKLFVIPFFIIHFGGFTGIHGIFVLMMFGKSDGDFMDRTSWPCFLAFVQILLNVVREALSIMTPQMRLAVLALFASHGISFVYNYLIKGEYARTNLGKLMAAPYGRVVVMHVAIIAGGFVLVALKSPVALLLVLVVLKTFLDVKLHLYEHSKKATAQPKVV
jgi:hypothetical protein